MYEFSYVPQAFCIGEMQEELHADFEEWYRWKDLAVSTIFKVCRENLKYCYLVKFKNTFRS